MSDNHLRHYRVLGIQPGTGWMQLRQAYKKQVNTWHPDRFQQDAHRKRQAEEKTKEITQAYKELAEYHKKHGALPLSAEEPETPAADTVNASPATATHPEPGAEPGSAAETPVSPPATHWRPTRRVRAAFFLALLGVGFYLWQSAPWERAPLAPAGTRSGIHVPAAIPGQDSAAHTAPSVTHFTVGSSIGDVYAAQGVPTRTEGDIWYFGNSKIYFADGKVMRWEENMDSPLKVSLVPGMETGHKSHFRRGSTKAEVMAVQGTPDRDAGNVWDYGVSRVYFEGDRVTGWQESPLYPLKVGP